MNETSTHSIPPQDIKVNSTSFMDPNGRVFEWQGEIFRGLYPNNSQFYLEFLDSNLYSELLSKGFLVETLKTNYEVDGFNTVLKHKKIDHISYCFEWPAEMLKDAAELTLQLCLDLTQKNLTLQDAYPWNIAFNGVKPVFIDFSSIVKVNEDQLWLAYQQFCNFFYHPLLIHSAGKGFVAQSLLMDYLDGISGEKTSKILSFGEKMSSPGYLTRIGGPEFLSKNIISDNLEAKIRETATKKKITIPAKSRTNFFKGLLGDIQKIKFPKENSHWEVYYNETKADALSKKKEFVDKTIASLKPKTVLDLGCNTGEFSVIAAKQGAEVVAFDADQASVSRLYNYAKENDLNIQCLVMNILNPTPAFGWCAEQFAPAHERLKSDLVLLLAVIHHLVFTYGQDFKRSLKSVKSFQKDYAIIEFVDKEDDMARKLRTRINFNDEWYNEENFVTELNESYSEVTFIGRVSPTRSLYLTKI